MNPQIMLRALTTVLMLGLLGLILWRWQINGWGSIVWLISALAMMVIRAPHAGRSHKTPIAERFAINTERVLLALVSVGGTLLPVIHLATGFLGFANFNPPTWITAIGVALLLPDLWLFWRSHADLGRNWSVTTELREEQTLISNGVYERVRHPMYAAIWLIFLAYPFLIHNWIVGPAAIAAFSVMYFVRVPIEESMMRDAFGAAYDDYIARTGRLWPRF